MKTAAFYTSIVGLLVCVPVCILAFHLEAPPRWTEETAVRTLLAVVLFGLIPSGIPAIVLAVLLLWKRIKAPADLLRSKPVLLAFLGAFLCVYAVHWWTFSDKAEFGLLVHALAVPFLGIIAILAGFGAGLILKK